MSIVRPARLYNCPDTNLITAGLVVVSSLKDHLPDFIAIRSDMADPFAPNLIIRLENASEQHLGETRNEGPKASTAPLAQAKELAKEKVSLLKNSIAARFKGEEVKIKKFASDLGLDRHYASFYAGNDQSAMELYAKFKSAETAGIKTEMTAAGLNAALFDNALAALQPISALNVSQEGEKGKGKEFTDAAIQEFNEIYKVLISICDQGKAIYTKSPAVRDKFVWDTIVKKL